MRLPGRLRLTTLGDVLGALHRERASGTLELREDSGSVHRVRFEQGLVAAIETDLSSLRLGDLLAGQGFLSARGQMTLARRLIEVPSKKAGELLIEEGLVSPELVRAGLRRQLRLRLDALYKLSDAQLLFHVPRPGAASDPPLSPPEFLYGRPRRRSHDPSQRAWFERARESGAALKAYATLGLVPGAERAAVQHAFRRLARSVHPDRFPNASAEQRAELLARFAELSAAYHALAS
jgi:hypothetical protein